jgi:hypothetical protein
MRIQITSMESIQITQILSYWIHWSFTYFSIVLLRKSCPVSIVNLPILRKSWSSLSAPCTAPIATGPWQTWRYVCLRWWSSQAGRHGWVLCYVAVNAERSIWVTQLPTRETQNDTKIKLGQLCRVETLFFLFFFECWVVVGGRDDSKVLLQITPPTSSERSIGSTSCGSDSSFHSFHEKVGFHLICCPR